MISALFCADSCCSVHTSGTISVTGSMIVTFSCNKISANKGKDSSVIFLCCCISDGSISSYFSALHKIQDSL